MEYFNKLTEEEKEEIGSIIKNVDFSKGYSSSLCEIHDILDNYIKSKYIISEPIQELFDVEITQLRTPNGRSIKITEKKKTNYTIKLSWG